MSGSSGSTELPASAAHEDQAIDRLVDALAAAFPYSVLETRIDDTSASVLVDKEAVTDIFLWLKQREDDGVDFLSDITAVDRLGQEGMAHRFEVVYQFLSRRNRFRLTLKAAVPEDDAELPSVRMLYRQADWAEREVWDLFGIRFRGHSNLKRILTHRDFVGHPLRKDFDANSELGVALDQPDDLIDEIGAWGESADDGGFSELVPVNLGPAHPAVRGVMRILVKLEGERIRQAACEIGYLHRGVEKEFERCGWAHSIPYTDRLNWFSPWLNNLAWCEAVEKLVEVSVPERARTIRVLFAELSRISDHANCLAGAMQSLGVRAAFWSLFEVRERIARLTEKMSGARHNPSFLRIGGLAGDLPGGFQKDLKDLMPMIFRSATDALDLVIASSVFERRTRGAGALDAATAVSHGWTGPALRACGVDFDLRKFDRTSSWSGYRFEVPTRGGGDVHDRLMIRFDEIVQSGRIIEQALDRLADGPIMTDDRRVALPGPEAVESSLQGMAQQVILMTQGFEAPAGEVYHAIEGANGELGFLLLSDGASRPRRAHCRAPSFYNYSAFPSLLEGEALADALPILASLNVVAGELDR